MRESQEQNGIVDGSWEVVTDSLAKGTLGSFGELSGSVKNNAR